MPNPTQRFSNRVADYVRYRPDYPPAVVDTLRQHCGWTGPVDIADLGSGTGLSALGFLDAGHRVYGVEPNAEMRQAAEALLSSRQNFTSIDGRAEATSLADHSVNLVIAAQAFHWFDVAAVAAESERILRPGGYRAVLWNLRRTTGSDFLDGYEALLQRFGTDYAAVSERYADSQALALYFGEDGHDEYRFDHAQHFDFEGLRGRLLSSSYAPAPGHSQHLPMLDALQALFDATSANGKVAFEYDTRLYVSTPCRASSALQQPGTPPLS
ncbi:MAG: methyltransferase domain-containing protein [Lysobacterales bacterium]|nr:methyltransferase domain-containing protein [Xanthomonadales bacterium]